MNYQNNAAVTESFADALERLNVSDEKKPLGDSAAPQVSLGTRPPVPLRQPKGWDQSKLEVAVRKIKPLVIVAPIKTSESKGTRKTLSNILQFVTGGADIEAWQAIKESASGHLAAVATFHWTSGTWEGLVKRFAKGFEYYGTIKREAIVEAVGRYFEATKIALPVDRMVNFTVADFWDQLKTLEYNKNADAGVQYRLPGGAPAKRGDPDVMRVCIGFLTEALEAARKDGYAGLARMWRDEPGSFAIALKNKGEKELREKFLEKTRPFYVFASHLQMLFAPIANATTGCMQNFLQNAESMSAYKFSWYRGGMKKLLEAAKARVATGVLFQIFYSDDSLVIMKIQEEWYLFRPDWNHMDASISRFWHAYIGKRKAWELGPGTKQWLAIARLESEMVMKGHVVVGHSLCVQKQDGNFSGSWDTTGVNMRVNVIPHLGLRDALGDTREKTLEVVQEAITKWLAWCKDLGLVYKEGTEVLTKFDFDDWEIPLSFMQYNAEFVEEVDGVEINEWIPAHSNLSKLLASLVYTGPTAHKGAELIGIRMARAWGLVASGGCIDPDVYETCKLYWERQASKKILPALDKNEELLPSEAPWLSFLGKYVSGEVESLQFPPRWWFLEKFTDNEALREESEAWERSVLDGPQSPRGGSGDPEEDPFGNWADQVEAQTADDLLNAVVSEEPDPFAPTVDYSIESAIPPPRPLGLAGHSGDPPPTLDKVEKDLRVRAAIAARSDRVASKNDTVGGSTKLGAGGKHRNRKGAGEKRRV